MNFIKKYAVFILIFFAALLLRFDAVSQKQYMFYDSPFSIIVSSPNNLSPEGKIFKKSWNDYSLDSGKIYTLKEFKKALFENKADLKSIMQDLKTLRNNKIDVSHTSLYCSILRIWNAGFDGIDVQKMIKRSAALNLVFFAFSFFFLYKLLSLIKEDKKFISIGLFFGFLSSGSISNTLLIREYALQEMLMNIFLYFLVLIYKRIFIEKNYAFLSPAEIFLFALVSALFSLSGYFSLFLVIPAYAALIIISLVKKNYEIFFKFSAAFALGAAVLLIIYPPYFENIFMSPHYIESENLKHAVLLELAGVKKYGFNIAAYLIIFLFYNGIFYIAAEILCFFGIIKTSGSLNDIEKRQLLFMLSLIFIYIYMVSFFRLDISVWYPFHGRFLFPALPALSAAVFVLFMYKWHKSAAAVCMILYFISVFLPLENANLGFTGKIIFKNNFKQLDLQNNYKLLSDASKYNIVIYKPSYAYINNIMYLPDDSLIRFENEFSKEAAYFDNYFLITADKETVKSLNGCTPPFTHDTEYVCPIFETGG